MAAIEDSRPRSISDDYISDGDDDSKDKKRSFWKGKWTPEEDAILRQAVEEHQSRNWKQIAEHLSGRSDLQCLHRWQKVIKPGLVKGAWTPEEDALVVELVKKYGFRKWSHVASHLPGRIGKQCRERWYNHLNPEIRKDSWTPEEDKVLEEAVQKYGKKWSEITKLLKGRPENSIKNRFYSLSRRRDKKLAAVPAGTASASSSPMIPDDADRDEDDSPASSPTLSESADVQSSSASASAPSSSSTSSSTSSAISASAAQLNKKKRPRSNSISSSSSTPIPPPISVAIPPLAQISPSPSSLLEQIASIPDPASLLYPVNKRRKKADIRAAAAAAAALQAAASLSSTRSTEISASAVPRLRTLESSPSVSVPVPIHPVSKSKSPSYLCAQCRSGALSCNTPSCSSKVPVPSSQALFGSSSPSSHLSSVSVPTARPASAFRDVSSVTSVPGLNSHLPLFLPKPDTTAHLPSTAPNVDPALDLLIAIQRFVSATNATNSASSLLSGLGSGNPLLSLLLLNPALSSLASNPLLSLLTGSSLQTPSSSSINPALQSLLLASLDPRSSQPAAPAPVLNTTDLLAALLSKSQQSPVSEVSTPSPSASPSVASSLPQEYLDLVKRASGLLAEPVQSDQ